MGLNVPALLYCIGEAALFGLTLAPIALHNVLVENNAFGAWCEPGQTLPCHNQEVAVSQANQFVSIVGQFAGITIAKLVSVMGHSAVAYGLIATFAVGLAICGVDLWNGWSFVLGMGMANAAGGGMVNFNFGFILPVATFNASATDVRFWNLNINTMIDVGYILAMPLAILLAWSTVAPQWVWFIVSGAGIAVVFMAWYRISVEPMLDEAALATAQGTDTRTLLPATHFLLSADFWIATAEFHWSLIFFTSLEASSARIAPFFGLERNIAFWVPLAVGASSSLILVWAQLPWGTRHVPGGILRLVLLVVFAVLYAVPSLRTPTTFFGGIMAASIWRSSALSTAMHLNYVIGYGGNESKTAALMIGIGAVICLAVGQAVTYWAASSSGALTACVLVSLVGGVLTEVMTINALNRLNPDGDTASHSSHSSGHCDYVSAEPSPHGSADEGTPLV